MNTYVDQERRRAATWKSSSSSLPAAARADASYVGKDGEARGADYSFCLPAKFAARNLLPEVRQVCLALFKELKIPWHAGVGDGPSNHLLSSQVQCANALGQMVKDASRIVLAFGDLLDIAEVLEIEPDRFLTFEYISPEDYFGEGEGRPRTRGAYCTSVDAAFRYRDSEGLTHLALVEWKYTEKYSARREEKKDAVRRARYEADYLDPAGPMRSELMELTLMFHEPFYQLMRQQMMAHRLEQDPSEPATMVHLIHVLAPENIAYQKSMLFAEHQLLGYTVDDVWDALRRDNARFIHLNPAVFCDPAITSDEYVARYAATSSVSPGSHQTTGGTVAGL